MILEPKHKNFKDEYKIIERVLKKLNIRRQISVLVANEQHYFQKLLNWWHSPFNVSFLVHIVDFTVYTEYSISDKKKIQV
jgi:hypothetical protein